MNFPLILFFVSASVTVVLALGSLWRRQRLVADWSFLAGMIFLAGENICFALTANANTREEILRWQELRLLALSLTPGTWLLFSLTYARGNARVFLTKWRLPIAAAFLLPFGVALVFLDALAVSLTETSMAHRQVVQLGWAGLTINLFLLVSTVVVLMNLERTYRASVGTMRWRIKFMLLGLGLLFAVRLYTSSQTLLFRGYDLALQEVGAGAQLLAALLILRSVFRTGRFAPDIYPSQSILEGSLTVLLSGIYLLVVGALAKSVAYWGGNNVFQLNSFLILVSVVLLAILLQSDRFHISLRRFISRNFNRPLYDYRAMWRKFTEGTASRVEHDDLCRSLVRLIADMFQSLSVSIWLVDEKKESLQLAASTSLPSSLSRQPFPQQAEAMEVIRYFRDHHDPVDIDLAAGDWAATLRQWQPGEFPNGGHRICAPLIGRGDVLGVITIGDRVSGALFTVQDFDMLKCVADHAAGSLLNVQLSNKLLQAKELEAFQTMAAFFVHDLKNSASTLNLMLQNLPVHFDDPVFREDTLRGIGKTVAHINHLIGRLGMLRQELKLQPVRKELHRVVDEALAGLESSPSYHLAKDLQPVPAVFADEEQILKVVTNLVLNATEAVRPGGQVNVTTSHSGQWVVVSVTDNGCGMSPEFIQRSLFRPFQTTKKSGLGIGMFQSKMIIEAHNGRITVSSKLGSGTTFSVYLPVASI